MVTPDCIHSLPPPPPPPPRAYDYSRGCLRSQRGTCTGMSVCVCVCVCLMCVCSCARTLCTPIRSPVDACLQHVQRGHPSRIVFRVPLRQYINITVWCQANCSSPPQLLICQANKNPRTLRDTSGAPYNSCALLQ